MKKKLVLIGGGGHCKSVIDIIEQGSTYEIHGILDAGLSAGEKICGYTILGGDEMIGALKKKNYSFLVTVGQIKSATIRIKLFEKLVELSADIATIISPSAIVSKHANIERGSVVAHRAVVNPDSFVGENCIINTGAIIEHDCIISAHSHISTAAVINGTCKIGKACFIGSNATLFNNISIAEACLVGAGSVVTKSITESNSILAGNPAGSKK